jgi:hypothetical protein
MELVIYYDHKVNEKTGLLENLQRINCHYQCEAKPKDIANTVYPNWYGISVNGGKIIRNSGYVSEI